MPIRTVRAVPYTTMKDFLQGREPTLSLEASDHEKTYIVSITNPGMFPLISRPTENQVALQFHDVEDTYDAYCGTEMPRCKDLIYFDEGMAMNVASLIKKAMDDPADVYFLANCQAGISRSGAVSHFVRQVAGIDFDDWKSKAGP